MGAYIYYRTADKKDADRAWEVLQEIEENKRLIDIEYPIHVNSSEDLKWAKENSPKEGSQYMIEYYSDNMGHGDFKVSGGTEDELGVTLEELLELLTVIFEKLNQEVKMKYLYGSCAFGGSYFSKSQIDRITNEGELFSNR
jgi:prepilin signal peptidase PulO-like enzyme (type II secretory pathway)